MRVLKLRWRGWLKKGLIFLSLGFLLLNTLAWQQAWAMTHYAPAGTPPPTIEALSLQAKVRAALLGITIARPQNLYTPRDVGLEYSVRQVEIADGGTLETWIVEHAAPRGVVLLFPGYASSKDSLLTPAAALHKLGYATMLVDFRGAGGSTGSDTTLGAREADDVAVAYAAAEQIWPGQIMVLYGVSMGSAANPPRCCHERYPPGCCDTREPLRPPSRNSSSTLSCFWRADNASRAVIGVLGWYTARS